MIYPMGGDALARWIGGRSEGPFERTFCSDSLALDRFDLCIVLQACNEFPFFSPRSDKTVEYALHVVR
jgi:hypothetical protein